MKSRCCFREGLLCLLTVTLLACSFELAYAADSPDKPVISSIRVEDTNVVVTVRVPAGFKLVTLECRSKLHTGSWQPGMLARLNGTGGDITFRLPQSRQVEILRVRADIQEPLPSGFYTGTNSFLGDPGSAGGVPPGAGPTAFDQSGAPRGVEGGDNREVVESDIWKIRGDTLYFFNQSRGLQVIDITNPDTAVVRGTLALPAVGEQMYLLNDGYVVLLARRGCYDERPGEESQVLVVGVTNRVPSITATLPVSGWITESRLVGTALYVASQAYRPVSGTAGTTWEWGTTVTSFDLAQPTAPVARDTLWVSGYGNVATATDRFLFVATQDNFNWWQSTVHLFDISAPDGTMRKLSSLRTAGRINDKFKLNVKGNTFTAISEDWHWDNATRLVTKLENFDLTDPSQPTYLGGLELGQRERLFATRFDENRVYVVTFLRIDPLWVVDNSNPALPRIAGHLDVPGWSTYIQPLGNRLVAVGVETNRVAVSLFDVSDSAKPALLSKALLGQNYSWSEANSDEKAFTLVSDANLILVPYQGDTTNGYTSRVQLIDLGTNTLTIRGVIEHRMQPRRATLHRDRIVSLSGAELLSVDATDRDRPQVRGEIELAWMVNRVFLQGDYLIEVANGDGWEGQPAVRVARAGAPDLILGQLHLTNFVVLGAAVRDGKLYLAQGISDWFGPVILEDDGTNKTPAVAAPTFYLTVIDLSNLPALTALGRAAITNVSFGYGSDLQPLWPKPDLLVWSGGSSSWYWWDVMPLRGFGPSGLWWPWYGNGGGRLLAFDVSNSAEPKFRSEVNLVTTNTWWNFSKAFTAGSLVYLSHQQSEFLEGVPPPTNSGGVIFPADAPAPANPTPRPPSPIGTWVSRHYLNVIDYSDSTEPTERKPVNIPGRLTGLSDNGAVIHTVGQHWTTNWYGDGTEWLDASAYDGVEVHLIDSLSLSNVWPHPVFVDAPSVFVGRSGYISGSTNVNPHLLETWALSDTGKFARLGAVTLNQPASTMTTFPGMLAVQTTDSKTLLFNKANPGSLLKVGEGRPPGCVWTDLEHADGALDRGLWLPLGAYGVTRILVSP